MQESGTSFYLKSRWQVVAHFSFEAILQMFVSIVFQIRKIMDKDICMCLTFQIYTMNPSVIYIWNKHFQKVFM